MERRVLVAIFLSFLVLYAYQALVVKPVPNPNGVAANGSTAGKQAPNRAPPSGPSAITPIQAPATTPAAAPLVGDTDERDIRVETRDVIAVFTNRGARLKSWRLKHYLDQQRQPQELVENEAKTEPLPFTLRTPDDQVTATINGALYSVSGAPGAGPVSEPVDLRFEYRDKAGVSASKTFRIDPASYLITFQGNARSSERQLPLTILWGPAVGDVAEESRYVQKPEALFFENGKVQRVASSDIAKQPTVESDFRYVGVDDNYFMTVALSPGPSKVTYQAVSIPPPGNAKAAARDLVAYSIEPKQSDAPLKFFFGPKDFDVLTAIDHDAVSAIDFGRFAVIVVPLLGSLKWVNSYVGNYGWSIVILTIIINAILFPLQHKSVVSMRKMQEIQPEIKAIQDRYAKVKTTDPAKQKMNQEMMALYRERGVNPASGCVPMLLTFPILFAMWALLSTAIELRGAPFFGWIQDLTAHDPYYILPILMGATTVWQQRISPASPDPAQQRMMMFMPVIFTVMFLWLPSGAVIYYAVSNLWRIGQQYLTNYLIGPPNVRTIRPAAERRAKRVGGGKTEAATRES